MPQFYTLEEAARVLGMSPEELKQKAQQREVRAFMDSGSWRFRVADVDELARRRGLGSDPELSLSDLDLVSPEAESTSDAELDLSEFQLGVAGADLGQPTIEVTKAVEDDILLDDLSLPPNLTSSSSTIIGMGSAGKLPTDSDVRLVPDTPPTSSSDSDVRLAPEGPPKHRPSDSDVTLVADEAPVPGSSDAFPVAPGPGSGSGDTAIRQSPLLGSSAEVDVTSGGESASDFELTPSSVIDALQPESGSDFELTALDESSDEFDATPLRSPGDSDVTGAEPASSGINLAKPSDSGINLMGMSGLGLQADSIELAPLSDEDLPTHKPQPAPAAPKPSLSATPPPAARAEKDIFEDTDFEVDAIDSGHDDQTMQLEAGSDFDLEEPDSGSEVFALDEEDVDQNAATAMAPAVLDEEEDDGFAAATADVASDEVPSAWDVESEGAGASASAAAPVLAAAGPQAEWSGLIVGALAATTVFMMLLAFVGMDLVRNLYESRGDTFVASGLVKTIAGLVGG